MPLSLLAPISTFCGSNNGCFFASLNPNEIFFSDILCVPAVRSCSVTKLRRKKQKQIEETSKLFCFSLSIYSILSLQVANRNVSKSIAFTLTLTFETVDIVGTIGIVNLKPKSKYSNCFHFHHNIIYVDFYASLYFVYFAMG